MKTVVVISQKGGVGKTVCADEIAFSLERSGYAVRFYDMDGQGGASHDGSCVSDADFAVVDTPGNLTDESISALSEADVVVVPTNATAKDIIPLGRTIAVIKRNTNAPILFVINGYNGHRIAKKFDAWFAAEFPDARVARLPQREAFRQADDEGVSVVEYAPKSLAASAVVAMTNQVREFVGVGLEPGLDDVGFDPALLSSIGKLQASVSGALPEVA